MTAFERDVIDRLARIEVNIKNSLGHDDRLASLERSRAWTKGVVVAIGSVGGAIGAAIDPLISAVRALKGG